MKNCRIFKRPNRLTMKKKFYHLLLMAIMSFCYISSSTAYVTLQDDGTLSIPQIRVGADYFSATLKKGRDDRTDARVCFTKLRQSQQ